jgi:2,3-bisphosphoglycerate-independent phosphoglycerate mutase
MVGHTGNLDAAITAVGCVDLCLGRILRGVARAGGVALVTADHGNADEMWEWDARRCQPKIDPATGRPQVRTAHTLNPVPLVLLEPEAGPTRFDLRRDLPAPGLGNVAATLLDLLGFRAPEDYLPSLLVRKDA